ncbi:asparagine synthetase B family protein [Aquabacterium sp. OR-4]|uniref:asparagine synthetase B family protein n=1 Tax=Aquabacterium sp. OR-4 TaxID=2978127 RepID=UPI0028CA7106|nr:asparagine synthase-related protein [Aquabacterium sp. OR-4]MDT7837646.1 asparagine synthase-related protein [Aquabacterium sp. OR-4]
MAAANAHATPPGASLAGVLSVGAGHATPAGTDPGTLSQCHGPWVHDGATSLGVWGDIVNRHALARQLGLPDDTALPALLLAGWRRWGQALPAQLDGVYALALRDGPQLRLLRDGSGLQNLFCLATAGRIAFAASLPELRALPGVGSAVSPPALHEYLRFLDISAPHCMLQDAQAVDAGEWLHWQAGALQAAPASVPAIHTAEASFDAAVDAVDQRLQAAVAASLAGAQRPVVMLSGGVDSALLAAIAARQRPDLAALTVGFDGDTFDETPTAARIAAHLGLRHQVLRFSHAQYLATLARVARHIEQPMADPATLATVLAFDHARAHHDLALEGSGADEIVGLLPPRHVRLAVAWGSRLPAAWRQRLLGLVRRVPALAGQAPLLDFEHAAETLIRWRGFRRAEIEALCGVPVDLAQTRFYRCFDSFPRAAHFERYSALMNVMPSERLNQGARISGLALRYPFWQHAVAGHMRQLRPDFRYLPGQPKRILRAVLARYVPRAIWDAPKHGFDFPLQAFLAANDHALVRHHLAAPRWQRLGLLSADGVDALGRRFVAGERTLMFRVWALVMLSAWLAPDSALPEPATPS